MYKSLLFKSIILSLFVGNFTISSAQRIETIDGTTAMGQNQGNSNTITVNGAELSYQKFGNGKPLLLLHDAGQTMNDFQKQINGLARGFQVIAVDFRGFGASKNGPQDLTYAVLTEDIGQLITQLKLEQVNVLGWGDGGIVALNLALQQKYSIAKVVIYSTCLWADTSSYYPEIMNWYKQQDEILWADPSKAFQSKFMKMKLAGSGILLTALRKIQVPVLVIASEKGLVQDKHSMLIRDNLNMGQLAILPGGNYFSPDKHAAVFNEIVLNFLQNKYEDEGRLPIKKDEGERMKGNKQGRQENQNSPGQQNQNRQLKESD